MKKIGKMTYDEAKWKQDLIREMWVRAVEQERYDWLMRVFGGRDRPKDEPPKDAP